MRLSRTSPSLVILFGLNLLFMRPTGEACVFSVPARRTIIRPKSFSLPACLRAVTAALAVIGVSTIQHSRVFPSYSRAPTILSHVCELVVFPPFHSYYGWSSYCHYYSYYTSCVIALDDARAVPQGALSRGGSPRPPRRYCRYCQTGRYMFSTNRASIGPALTRLQGSCPAECRSHCPFARADYRVSSTSFSQCVLLISFRDRQSVRSLVGLLAVVVLRVPCWTCAFHDDQYYPQDTRIFVFCPCRASVDTPLSSSRIPRSTNPLQARAVVLLVLCVVVLFWYPVRYRLSCSLIPTG